MRVERIGDATLYLGDCREILPTLGAVDAVVTDPPYGIGLAQKTSDFRGSKFFDNGASLEASIKYQDDADYVKGLITGIVADAIERYGRAIIFCGPRMLREYPQAATVGCVFSASGAGRTSWGFQCCHPILFYGKDPFLADGLGSRPNSFSDIQPNRETIDHPCPKPVKWMEGAVWRGSRVGETVLDPFMGSGTTGVACARLNRKFIGIEIEPTYFDIACRRIEEAQRQKDLFIHATEPAQPAPATPDLFGGAHG